MDRSKEDFVPHSPTLQSFLTPHSSLLSPPSFLHLRRLSLFYGISMQLQVLHQLPSHKHTHTSARQPRTLCVDRSAEKARGEPPYGLSSQWRQQRRHCIDHGNRKQQGILRRHGGQRPTNSRLHTFRRMASLRPPMPLLPRQHFDTKPSSDVDKQWPISGMQGLSSRLQPLVRHFQ